MNLSTFQTYLTSKAPLPMPPRNYLNGEDQQLLKWAASLPMQSEVEQTSQLEKILTELSVADIDDKLRLRLMSIVMTAMDRLIAILRKHYIYEVGPLSDSQFDIMNQVKSLYYLSVLVYDAVVRRESMVLSYQQQREPNPSIWKRLITPTPVPSYTLAIAIYQSLLTYQKLLCEKAICYQKPPLYMWAALNQLYHLACQHNITLTDLTSQVVTRQATSIHQLYCQVCLHSLLNVLAMRRPSILLAQRLLPEWAANIEATLTPQTHTRIFVDLKSDCPPEYLTTATAINPYEAHHNCLFIELEPLAEYLRQRQDELLTTDKALTEYRLVTKILMSITHRYIARPMTKTSKYSAKKRATIIVSFNDIHYRIAGGRSLLSMIVPQALDLDHRPRYDTAPKKGAIPQVFEIEVHDSTETMSHFRTLRLLTAQDIVAQRQSVIEDAHKRNKGNKHSNGNKDNHFHKDSRDNANKTNPMIPPLNEIFEPITLEEAGKADDKILHSFLTTAPPYLRIMSLFLLSDHRKQNHKDQHKENWSLGMVRWLTIDEEYIEAEGQILGHAPTACALRLDTHDQRSQSFVPALLLAAEDTLQTAASILVPSYHFRANDKVIIRLQDKEKPLRLQRSVLSTEEFTQYEVIRL